MESWLTLSQPADKAQELSEPRKIILDMLLHWAKIVIIQLLNLIVVTLFQLEQKTGHIQSLPCLFTYSEEHYCQIICLY